MNISKFTQKSVQAVQDLEKVAYQFGNQEIEEEHLLYALLEQEDSLILKLIEKMEIDKDYFRNSLNQALDARVKVSGGELRFRDVIVDSRQRVVELEGVRAAAKMANTRHNCFAINLTPETHDQSFAMTSSYSNMYLATYLAFNLDKLDEITAEVEKLAVAGQHFLDDQFGLAQKIVDEFDYNRIVYLGNIGLKGVAQESALKTLELTAGKVATMYDSELGFRHGPKSIIDDNTLTVAYLSDDEYRRRYELDLVKEMAHQRKGNKIAVVYNHDCEGMVQSDPG